MFWFGYVLPDLKTVLLFIATSSGDKGVTDAVTEIELTVAVQGT